MKPVEGNILGRVDNNTPPSNSFNRSANSAPLIENLDGFGGLSRLVNSDVRRLTQMIMMRQNMLKLLSLIFGLSLLLSAPLHDYSYSFKAEAAQKSRPRKPRRSTRAFSGSDEVLARAFKQRASNIQVEGQGVVRRVLSDDDDGSRHQRFIVALASGQTLLIAHNIDLAPRVVGLRKGDAVSFSGEYEWNAEGGVIHWTHRDPSKRHAAGWIKHNGKVYQ
jgi:Protein of unknown function (DUF3465)